jgi:hypothetical protein
MTDLPSNDIREYLLRSYTAADGLWFMAVEERLGFDVALDMDAKVWSVMPKIQSRQLRLLLGAGPDMAGLKECFTAKLMIEGFIFKTTPLETGFEVRITQCPWYDKMLRACRAHLAPTVGNRICPVEYSVWAAEFGCRFLFSGEKKICEGGSECRLVFENAVSTD